MYTFWIRQCLAINYTGAGLFLDAYGQWLQYSCAVWSGEGATRVEPWLDQVDPADVVQGRRPKVVNCAAGYYSCCNLNLARLKPANAGLWSGSSMKA